ncbi:MAG: alpha/beta hydrolase [Gemmataceae bacterium]|nr:alpha/beta hydrolase [Gemmataceae bacterium]
MGVKQVLFKLLGPLGRWLVQRRLRSTLGIDLHDLHIERNIVYGRGGGSDLKLDLAMPKQGDGPFGAVVLIAGGAWQYYAWPGLMEGILELLATRGYVTIEPHYRVIPAGKFPAPVEDCKAAVRWLRANAGRYRIDPDRVAALGPSSGGHLASMLGLTEPADGFEGQGGHPEQSSKVQAVVDLYGIVDMTDYPWRERKEKGLLVPFLGATFAENPDLYRKASPVEYVRPGAPPFLIIHGDADITVPPGQSRRLAERLEAVKASVQLIIVPGAGHGWGPPRLAETIDQVSAFLAAHLKPGATG